MDTGISGTVYTIKAFLVSAMQSFPLIMTGLSLVMATCTGSLGYFILFISLALIVPVATLVMNKLFMPILGSLIKKLPIPFVGKLAEVLKPDSATSVAADVCKMIPYGDKSSGPLLILPSYWMAATAFFFTFVFINGLSLYNYDAPADSDEKKVGARKSQAIIGMILSVLLLIIFITWRLITGCESPWSIVAVVPISLLAVGIFKWFKSCNLLRIIDIYGIGARLMPTDADKEPTQVCFPVEVKG